MSEFYKEAILAAHSLRGTKPRREIRELETWQDVASALDALDAIGRCHAIYCDWLLQLNASGGRSQIQIRDLLLGQGALAANYLGEMAQNADDAGATSLLVALEDDWLIVANNGRALSSLNLLGLCRFFIHTDGKIVGLLDGAIGKFGIGFKSCHRVADEVYVHSWGQREEFGFRLPISQSGTDISQPDTALLVQLSKHINRVGKIFTNSRANQELGHCTPEAFEGIPNHLPNQLKRRIDDFRNTNQGQGVWFALHLHERGRAEAANRINDQTDALYELCPVFLNHLRNVTLQDRKLRLGLGGVVGTDVNGTSARRVTFEVTHNDLTRNDRLLLLTSKFNQKWKIALPTDSEFRIKRPVADQFSLRSGGAYAYLPLPSLDWPWNIHFHLNAPTNLARSEWNPANIDEVNKHIRDAAQKLVEWTLHNAVSWHQSWQPADILTLPPSSKPPGSSTREFAGAVISSLQTENVIRTLWGGFSSTENALGLRLEPGQTVINAWAKIATYVPSRIQERYPLVMITGGIQHLALPNVTTLIARDIFVALRESAHDQDFWAAYIQAVLGMDAAVAGGYSRSEMLEDALGSIMLDRPTNSAISFQTASESRYTVRLTDSWHALFRSLSANWLSPNSPLSSQPVFGIRVSQMLRSLATSAETPTGWDEVVRMSQDDFRLAGDSFWSAQRASCPAEIANDVINAIWIQSGSDWVALSELWLGDEAIAMMSGVVRGLLRRHDELNDRRKRLLTDKLRLWDLDVAYQTVIRGEF
jgi:hypothetical protein